MNDHIPELVDFFAFAEGLKSIKRFKNTPNIIERESSADHSWRLALMVTSVVELLNIDVDKARAIKLALVHNLFEVESDNTDYILIATGEVDKQAKIKLEQEQMAAIAKRFPMIGLYELFSELITNKTNEARLVNALSKIETLGHLVNCGYGVYDTPELIAVYADEAVSTYPDLLPLLGETKKRLQKEFEKGNFVWRDEYNLGL